MDDITAGEKPEGGWDPHRRERLRAMKSTTPAQRLAWVEQALRLAERTGALQRTRAARARRENG